MSWITPITDRTVEDTRFARNNQGNEQKNKGALNYHDLNRIEDNYRYLIDRLESNSMFIPHMYRASAWQERDIPCQLEIDRIRDNYNNLVRLFLINLGLPILVHSQYVMYTEVNDWERIAAVGKTMFESMEQEYRFCGTEESGGDRLL